MTAVRDLRGDCSVCGSPRYRSGGCAEWCQRVAAYLQEEIERTNPRARTRCLHGHEFTPENTYVTPNGRRECRECRHYRRRNPRSDRGTRIRIGRVA